jgi:molybdopterin-guanine dinucleotide biosynthesis protein A
MPLIEPADLRRLLDAIAADDADAAGAMHRWADGPSAGRVEPLPSAWRVQPAAALFQAALARGWRGPMRLADNPAVQCLTLRHEHDAIRWRSINTPQDMQAVAHAAGLNLHAAPSPTPRHGGPGAAQN